MGGKRIEQAKNALILFLKSLPENSMFNIISFGSNFQRMYPASIKYNDQTVEETVDAIEEFDADFEAQKSLHLCWTLSTKRNQ